MLLEQKLRLHIRDVADYPKPGINFKDITPVLASPALMEEVVGEMVRQYKNEKIDAIAAIEARGFILGSILAHELKCSFLPVRKLGKLPYRTISEEYALEYGTSAVEMHTDAVREGMRVLIHDDLLATGGTAAAAARLVKASGGIIAGFSFLINLSFLPGDKKLKEDFGVEPHYLLKY
jgi:adenine phosphoribosyltransferase